MASSNNDPCSSVQSKYGFWIILNIFRLGTSWFLGEEVAFLHKNTCETEKECCSIDKVCNVKKTRFSESCNFYVVLKYSVSKIKFTVPRHHTDNTYAVLEVQDEIFGHVPILDHANVVQTGSDMFRIFQNIRNVH